MTPGAQTKLTRYAETVGGKMLDRGHLPGEWKQAGPDAVKVQCRRMDCGLEVKVHADGEVEGSAHSEECEG